MQHTQAPRTPSTVAWRDRPSAAASCAPRRLRTIFLSSICLSPAFLAPSTVAKLSPKYLSSHSRCPVTTLAPVPCFSSWESRLLRPGGACKVACGVSVAVRLSFPSPACPATRCQSSPLPVSPTVAKGKGGVRREIENHPSCGPNFPSSFQATRAGWFGTEPCVLGLACLGDLATGIASIVQFCNFSPAVPAVPARRHGDLHRQLLGRGRLAFVARESHTSNLSVTRWYLGLCRVRTGLESPCSQEEAAQCASWI